MLLFKHNTASATTYKFFSVMFTLFESIRQAKQLKELELPLIGSYYQFMVF